MSTAEGISADGQFIGGSGANRSGNPEAWLARLAPTLPGDFNHDGAVDAADYVVWRKTDGTQQGYDAWRAHFGQTAGSGATASDSVSAVPEPVSLLLLLAGLALPHMRRTRARPLCAGLMTPHRRRPKVSFPPPSPSPEGRPKIVLKSARRCAMLPRANCDGLAAAEFADLAVSPCPPRR